MRLEFARSWVRFPAGLRCVFFSSDPAVSSSIFVGAEREENLIRNIPTRASLRLNGSKSSEFSLVAACCRLEQSGSPRSGKRTDSLVKVENSHTVPVVAS